MIVLKFGGSSLESPEAVERVCGIVADRVAQKPVVVVSAFGKTTNRLLEAATTAAAGNSSTARQILARLRDYHTNLAEAVTDPTVHRELSWFLDEHYREMGELVGGIAVIGELTPRSIDAISSYGERISSRIMAWALQKRGVTAEHLDARQVIITDDRFSECTPLFDKTYARLRETVPQLIGGGNVVVMGGFIAMTEGGVTATLGRGGSDYTASIVGAGLSAEEVQIWTDVDGVLTADPSIQPNARRLKYMSFDEAAELAYFGARVLHPATLVPAVETGIPVRVLNSRRPDGDGTLIVRDAPPVDTVIKSIAYKEGITVVDICSSRMLMAHGFLAKIFDIFDRNGTSVDMVSTSEVSVSLTVDRPDRLPEITREIESFATVSITAGQALVCVVGENLRRTPGIGAKVFGALNGINIRMVSQGASRMNLGFVIDETELAHAINALHDEFFAVVDQAVFA